GQLAGDQPDPTRRAVPRPVDKGGPLTCDQIGTEEKMVHRQRLTSLPAADDEQIDLLHVTHGVPVHESAVPQSPVAVPPGGSVCPWPVRFTSSPRSCAPAVPSRAGTS